MGRTKAPSFDDFWKAYPLHKGKIDAEKAWNRLSAGDKQKALAGIPRYREFIQQTGTNIKYPQGWLNGRRWEDEMEPKAPVQGDSGTKTELSQTSKPKFNASMLGQMNARGKADELTMSAIIAQEPTTDGPADTLSDMDTW